MVNVCEALSKRRQRMALVAVLYDRDRHCLPQVRPTAETFERWLNTYALQPVFGRNPVLARTNVCPYFSVSPKVRLFLSKVHVKKSILL